MLLIMRPSDVIRKQRIVDILAVDMSEKSNPGGVRSAGAVLLLIIISVHHTLPYASSRFLRFLRAAIMPVALASIRVSHS